MRKLKNDPSVVALLLCNILKPLFTPLNYPVTYKKCFLASYFVSVEKDGCGCWVTFCNLAVNKLRVMAHKGGLSAGLSGYVGQGFETCVLVCARQ